MALISAVTLIGWRFDRWIHEWKLRLCTIYWHKNQSFVPFKFSFSTAGKTWNTELSKFCFYSRPLCLFNMGGTVSSLKVTILNNYRMRLSMIWRIMQIEEMVPPRPKAEGYNTLLDLHAHVLRKPNSTRNTFSQKSREAKRVSSENKK